MGVILTVTDEDQVILDKDILRQLGVRSGDRLEIEARPAGPARPAARMGRPIASLLGLLKDATAPVLTVEEINEAAAAGWSGER